MEDPRGHGGRNERDERTGNASTYTRPERNDDDGRDAHGDGRAIDRACVLREDLEPFDEFRRHGSHLQAESVLHLARRDDDRNPRGESRDEWMWNEANRRAETGEAEADEQHTGHERGDGETADAVLLHDAVDDHDEGAGRAADLYSRASEPLAIAKAMDSGRATTPTMTPAMTSRTNCSRE